MISCEIFFDGLGGMKTGKGLTRQLIGIPVTGSELAGVVLCLVGRCGDRLCEGNVGSYSGGMLS